MPLIAAPKMLNSPLIALFFLGSGIAQVFWMIPMIKRWRGIWYYVGIAGNVAFILLYVITRFPGNPVNSHVNTLMLSPCKLIMLVFHECFLL